MNNITTELCDELLLKMRDEIGIVELNGKQINKKYEINSKKWQDASNVKVSKKVLERLLTRHAILRVMEPLESEYTSSKSYIPNTQHFWHERESEFSKNAKTAKNIYVGGVFADNGESNRKVDFNSSCSRSDAPTELIENAANSCSGIGVRDSRVAVLAPRLRKFGRSKKYLSAMNLAPLHLKELISREEEMKNHILSSRNNRVYKLAVTDLFVEKAIAYLELDSKKYNRNGWILFIMGITAIIVASVISIATSYNWSSGIHEEKHSNVIVNIVFGFPQLSFNQGAAWISLLSGFIKAFTMYGFLVIFSVYCWRLGKAMMDQAERLRERRHSLRQGRLFIHLNDGEVSASDLEKAFDWNVSKGNAFANVPTETSAPWGSVIKEALKAVPEAFKKSNN